MKKLYYTVEMSGDFIDNIFDGDGNKSVSVYTIENNIPTQFFSLDLEVQDNTEEKICDWMDDNGYGDEIFKLTQL